jgi:hypothetical protein
VQVQAGGSAEPAPSLLAQTADALEAWSREAADIETQFRDHTALREHSQEVLAVLGCVRTAGKKKKLICGELKIFVFFGFFFFFLISPHFFLTQKYLISTTELPRLAAACVRRGLYEEVLEIRRVASGLSRSVAGPSSDGAGDAGHSDEYVEGISVFVV